MPSLQDIEQFKKDLNFVGNEEEILSERGESIEDIQPPAEGLSDDLSQLLELGGQEEPGEFPFEGSVDEPSDDPGGLGDTQIFEDEIIAVDSSDDDLDDFDIDGIFPETETSDSDESAAEPVADEFAFDEAVVDEAVVDEAVVDEPDSDDLFSGISEAEYAGLTGDLSEPANEEEVAEIPAPSEEEEFDFDEDAPIDDFAFPDEFTDEFAAEEPGVETPVSADETPVEDFAVEELDEVEGDTLGTEEEGLDLEEFTIPDEFAADDLEKADVPEDLPEATEETDFPEEVSFEEGVDEFEIPAADAGTPESMEFSDEAFDIVDEEGAAAPDISDVGEDDFDLDDFSLGDIGEQFGVSEEITEDLPSEEEMNPALAVGEQLPGSAEKLDLSDDQFGALQTTLANLPRNLRIIIEEAIGEEQLSGANLESLIDALVRGRSPKELAALTGRITGQRISIPSAYEKRTGAEFEEEKDTFAYLFAHTILPFLRVAALVLAALGVLSFLGYRFVYRPIRATILYNRGLEQIDNGGHFAGNELFDEAKVLWRTKGRYYQYAESFVEQHRDDLAADKYEELLVQYQGDRRGLLDYAHLETYQRADYEKAELLLEQLIGRNKYMYDYDGLLQYGDNYMEWALEDFSKYENARRAYATLIGEYGTTDELLFRMLKYFIRTDNLEEVLALKDHFQGMAKLDLDVEVYSELGGYLVTQDEKTGRSRYASDARDILFRALETDEFLPETHYHLARHFRSTEDYGEEKKALAKAFGAFGLIRNRNTLSETRFIDTINRQGEAAFRDGEYLQAEDKYLAAKKRFEAAESVDKLVANRTFGRIYSNLADVYYYVSANYPAAMRNYSRALKMDYAPPDLYYKLGYIHYRNEQFDEALLRFYQSAGQYSSNPNLMFTTANTLYSQGLFSAAQGYYLHILTDLETKRRNIPDLTPEERPEHRALLENLMRTYNNLGATLFRLSERTGDSRKATRALVNLTTSSEFFDRLTRDRQTFVRTESKNLSFLNTRAIIYPEPGFDVEIYNEIPRDLSEIGF